MLFLRTKRSQTIMKKIHFLLFFILTSLQAQTVSSGIATEGAPKKWNFGVEIDALPYLTGGYFGAAWLGKNQWRGRALLADVQLPEIIIKDGFTKHHVRGYAVLVDYFLKPSWKGWWVGAGPVYWKSSIQQQQTGAIQHFDNLLLNGSLGYHFTLLPKVYLSPWAGLSCKVAGNDRFTLDQQPYRLPFFNPEISIKLGVFL